MLLEVHERMQLAQLLPAKGHYEMISTLARQREVLLLTPEEAETINLQKVTTPDGSTRHTWDLSKVNLVVKDIPIDAFWTKYFKKKLVELEGKGELTEQLLSLYEKFVNMSF